MATSDSSLPSLHDMQAFWTKKMAEFEGRLKSQTTPNNPTLVQLNDEFQQFKSLFTDMLRLLSQQMQVCTTTIDRMEMRHRQKNLLFSGIPEDSTKEISAEVEEVIQEKMSLPHISRSSFIQCVRLGSSAGNRPRPILVRFSDRSIKSEVWKSKTKLRGSSVSVFEFLTKTRQSLFREARLHFGMKCVWTLDGVVNIKLPCGSREKINTHDDLNQLFSKYPKAASAEALPSIPSHGSPSKDAKHSSPMPLAQDAVLNRKQGGAFEDTKRSRRPALKK